MQDNLIKEERVEAQFGRVKGAPWFQYLHKKDVMVLGQGGIGSWVSLLLARAGCTLYTFDMDLFEEHNMTGQLVSSDSIGHPKNIAVKKMVEYLSPSTTVHCYGEYTPESPTNDIVVCGFDRMVPRKTAFENWKKAYAGNPNAFFQDGRLLAEQLQIFNIAGDDIAKIEEYEREHLFSDEEAEEADCTFKQTSHVAAIIAGKMVGFLTNWASNVQKGKRIRQVPFFHQYLVPLNIS